MLVKLLPDQVSRQWEVISYAIKNSLPPNIIEDEEIMNNILMSVMCGTVVCWASFEKVDDNVVLNGIVTTVMIKDFASGVKSLLVYTIYSIDDFSRKVWKDGLETLIKYGRFNNCKSIVGYTKVPSLVEFIKRVGGEAEYTFASIPLW